MVREWASKIFWTSCPEVSFNLPRILLLSQHHADTRRMD